MGALIDIILVLVLLLTVFVGAKNGILKCVLGIAAVVFALLFSSFLTANSADTVYEHIAMAPVEHLIEEKIPQGENLVISKETVDSVIDSLPKEFVQGAQSFGVDIEKIAQDVGGMKIDRQSISHSLAEKIARPIVTAVLRVLIFAALFLIINVILQIIITAVCSLIKVPVVKNLDRTLGGVFGAVKAIIVISFMALFLETFASLLAGTGFANAVSGSKIVEFIMSSGIFSRLALI